MASSPLTFLAWLHAAVIPRLAFALSLLTAFGGSLLLAQETSEVFQSGYFSEEWTVDDGLPHNIINQIVQNPEGYLWMASAAGLVRFDGRVFKEFTWEKPAGEMNDNIRDLAVDPSGDLVMLPGSGGIMRLHQGKISVHPASVAIAGKNASRLFIEPSGAIWIDAEGGELVRWAEGRSASYHRGQEIPPIAGRCSFAIDAHHRLWIAKGDYLGHDENGQLIWSERIGSHIVVAPARSGGIWISTSEQLMKLDDGAFKTIVSAPEWSASTGDATQQLFEDRQGNLWVGTRHKGLLCVSEKGIHAVQTPADNVTAILQDSEDNIWIGTHGGGVSRLRSKPFISLENADGTSDSVRTSLCEDKGGALWFAGRRGVLARYFEGKIDHYSTALPGRQPEMYLVCPDRDGHVWVSTSTGLFTISSEHPTQLEAHPSGLKDVRILLAARNGDIWAVHGGTGIGYFRNGDFHECPLEEPSRSSRLRVLAEGPDGTIWAGNGARSLLQFSEGKFISRFSSSQIPGGTLNALMIDPQGTFWLATTRGLVVKSDTGFKPIGLKEGLSDEFISQILEDNHGRLWCANRRGFSVLSLMEVRAVADGRAPRVSEATLGKEEGLPKAFALFGLPPIPWKSQEGRLWFATHAGFVGIDSNAPLSRQIAPPVYIDQVEIDKHPASPSAPLRLGPGNHHVAFRFVAINYSSPGKVHLRHQLIGYDADWVETGSDRTANYVYLPPGDYRMKVTAKNQDGNWNETAAELLLTIPPAWWQTWGFRLGSGLAFATAFGWLVRYGSQRRLRARLKDLEREHELERERARIARDLHDELGYSVTQIGLIADRLKSDASSAPALKDALGELAACTRRLSGELEGVVWTVSPKNDQWNRLASYIRQFALNFFADTAIACTVEGVEDAPAIPLAPEIQHHLLAIIKESLNNILKHAAASRVEISLVFADNRMTLRVADNGVGFDPSAPEHSERNGLTNLHARTREMGGTLMIVSSLGSGSEIQLDLPLRAPFKRLVTSPS